MDSETEAVLLQKPRFYMCPFKYYAWPWRLHPMNMLQYIQ